MKKTLTLIVLLLITGSAFSQNIVSPQVDQTDDDDAKIAKIETDNQFTIVTFAYTANSDNT